MYLTKYACPANGATLEAVWMPSSQGVMSLPAQVHPHSRERAPHCGHFHMFTWQNQPCKRMTLNAFHSNSCGVERWDRELRFFICKSWQKGRQIKIISFPWFCFELTLVWKKLSIIFFKKNLKCLAVWMQISITEYIDSGKSSQHTDHAKGDDRWILRTSIKKQRKLSKSPSFQLANSSGK